MKNTEIKILLDKYFKGESNLREENILRHYFLYEDVAPDLIAYQAIFEVFADESQVSPQHLDEDIFKEEQAKGWAFQPGLFWAGAAIALVFISSWFFMQQQAHKQKMPSHKELMVAQKHLHHGLMSLNHALHKSQELIKKTDVLEQNKNRFFYMGLVYDKGTNEMANLKYINESIMKLQELLGSKKSINKLII